MLGGKINGVAYILIDESDSLNQIDEQLPL